MTTSAGHRFVAPKGWSVIADARTTVLVAPEGDSRLVVVDVEASNAEQAVEKAWAEVGVEPPPIAGVERDAENGGWTQIHRTAYAVPPTSGRWVYAEVRHAQGSWSVLLIDMSNAVAEKRYAQIQLVYERAPRGRAQESFEGRRAHTLDTARVRTLTRFVEEARLASGVPGVALGVVQGKDVVFLGGFGTRRLSEPEPVDADTLFMVASNTKPLTTLMLAKLVDQGRLRWDSPAQAMLPGFALGDVATTKRVEVRHLVCACTGLPRQDFEWLLEFGSTTPEQALEALATMQPTSAFGELYQYSNPLAGAAGYLGGHVVHPDRPLGEAYALAMESLVFDPLGMSATTFDWAAVQRGNWAAPHALALDGTTAPAVHDVNASSSVWRPAGAAWSSARDMLAYVRMELGDGIPPGGERYIGRDALLARRRPQVASGRDATYGMGLEVKRRNGVAIVHHGGDMIGYHSDVFWLPEHGVGVVVLTNGAPGWAIVEGVERKLLELLFDGRDEAEALVRAEVASHAERVASLRRSVEWPANRDVTDTLATHYANATLGDLWIRRKGSHVAVDFGEWQTDVASRENADGTTSLVGVSPGIDFIELVAGVDDGRRTLTLFDYQHTYVFTEV